VNQLQAFAVGTRKNDVYARARVIARSLIGDEIARLAAYYSSAYRRLMRPAGAESKTSNKNCDRFQGAAKWINRASTGGVTNTGYVHLPRHLFVAPGGRNHKIWRPAAHFAAWPE
jgi:hypothetical protein